MHNVKNLAQKTYTLAVVGNPIQHSLSPFIHHSFAESLTLQAHYSRILAPLVSENKSGFTTCVTDFFEQGGHGLNITVPFKEEAFAMCEVLSPRAKHAQAVNTLFMHEGKLHGDNTDGEGLVHALTHHFSKPSLENTRIAIIGAGGACRGVILPLLQAKVAHITIANRTLAKAEQLVTDMANSANICPSVFHTCSIQELTGNFDIIVNATSSSLHGQSLSLSQQLHCSLAYDMVYKKDGSHTPFMADFAKQGTSVFDGFSMLIGQAAVSFHIWTGHMPDLTDHELMTNLKQIIS